MDTTRELLTRLNRHIDYSAAFYRKLDRYYHNHQPLAMLPEEVRNDCGDRLPLMRVNWCRLAVDSIAQRLRIDGFRLPGEEPGSSMLWDIWESNNLPEFSAQAHVEALVHGRCFVCVWAGPDGFPRITVESGRQCTVWSMPGNHRRIAGLKRWVEADGRAMCTLFEPDRITKWQSPSKISLDPYLTEAQLYSSFTNYDPYSWWDFSAIPASGWELRADPIPNPLGVVPLIPITNRPRLLNWGESELIDVLPLVDAINKLATDMMIASEYFATPRRYATGIEIQTRVNPETGEEEAVDPFSKQKGRNWLAESENTKFGGWEGAPLDNFTQAIVAITSQIGALAALPPHYLSLAREPASADALRASEAPLAQKCRLKQQGFSLAWDEAMRIALTILEGVRRPNLSQLETVWASPETRGIAAEADAAQKMVAMGLPVQQVAQDRLGMTPQQIEQAEAMKRVDVAAQGSPAFTQQGLPAPAWETSREINRSNEIAAR